jgi:hypothetical protein
MSEQLDNLDDDLDLDPNLPIEEELEEIDYSKPPGEDDDDDYWKGFAESKGWKSDPSQAPAGMYRDYRAFVQYHDKQTEGKELKGELGNVTKQLSDLAKNQGEFARKLAEQSDREKQELIDKYESKKKEAHNTGDIDAYVKADEAIKKLDSVNTEAKPEEQEVGGEPEVITSFRTSNPELLSTSDKYDPDLNLIVENKFNAELMALGRVPSDEEVQAMLNRVVNAEKGKLVKYQSKPQRKAPGTNQVGNNARSTSLDPGKLDAVSREFYDSILSNSGEVQAKIFLEARLGVKS